MTLNRVKLGRAVTFMKYHASAFSLIFRPYINFNFELNRASAIKFTESCRAGGKSAYKENLQKHLPISLFPSNLSLFVLNILRA